MVKVSAFSTTSGRPLRQSRTTWISKLEFLREGISTALKSGSRIRSTVTSTMPVNISKNKGQTKIPSSPRSRPLPLARKLE